MKKKCYTILLQMIGSKEEDSDKINHKKIY